ncbi:hypothetical protein IHE44_0008310 [Lamprotornis superbus]|uniref:Uncharacterized protein n=1 Tax=Lamprotornis superbus TaxID=245042 RepID=A0A835TTZ8_9PASS|nr:hypothetical protein IHE44_0008310 [Lamprotornis superbus]
MVTGNPAEGPAEGAGRKPKPRLWAGTQWLRTEVPQLHTGPVRTVNSQGKHKQHDPPHKAADRALCQHCTALSLRVPPQRNPCSSHNAIKQEKPLVTTSTTHQNHPRTDLTDNTRIYNKVHSDRHGSNSFPPPTPPHDSHKLFCQASPGLGNGCGIAQHADCPLNFGQVAPRNHCGGLELRLALNPVGHQSTNWMVRLVLMAAMAALTSLGTTSPRYSMQHAMYLPCRGSHFTIWLEGSKQALVISATDSCSWYAFSAEIIGEYVTRGKWIRGYQLLRMKELPPFLGAQSHHLASSRGDNSHRAQKSTKPGLQQLLGILVYGQGTRRMDPLAKNHGSVLQCLAQFSVTYDCRFQVHKHSPWDVLPRTSLAEEGVEGVVPAAHALVAGHVPVGLDAVLQAVELPARIADLHACLPHDALQLKGTVLSCHCPPSSCRLTPCCTHCWAAAPQLLPGTAGSRSRSSALPSTVLKVQLHLREADGKPSFLRKAVPAQTKLTSTPYGGTLFPWDGTPENLHPLQRPGPLFILLI